jgi:hypothetical protein
MTQMISGTLVGTSARFSPRWDFTTEAGEPVATALRDRHRRRSRITGADGTVWDIVHDGWEWIRVMDGDFEIASAERTTVTGREWSLLCGANQLQLSAESSIGRRWTIGPPGAHLASFTGGPVSYNRLSVVAGAPIPLSSVMLAWQVVVRAWEAASSSVVDG